MQGRVVGGRAATSALPLAGAVAFKSAAPFLSTRIVVYYGRGMTLRSFWLGWFAGALLTLLISGCTGFGPLKPGSSRTRSADLITDFKQSENPQQSSSQTTEEQTRRELPGGTNIVTIRRTMTQIGAAQKDTGRDLAARLASLKGVSWAGVVVFLFGVASAFWAPLKVVVGSITTSAAIAGAGLALIFLPTMIVGHEKLILLGALGAAGAWFFAHRHGKLRGTVEALKGGSDAR